MKAFMERHTADTLGTLSGFDRVVFRGTLRSISYVKGADRFLGAARILLKDFGTFAEACTQDIRAHAEAIAREAGREFRYLASSAERKEDVARAIAERDHVERGLVCVLYAVEPCMSCDVRGNRETKWRELVRRERKCCFFYFYFMDREFGLMHVRLQSWFPFDIQVCLNGRSYLAQQLDREGIAYTRVKNCFTAIDDLPRAQELIDQLTRRDWAKTLAVLGTRANPLLGTRLAGVRPYYWTVRQCEYATDVLFRDGAALDRIYPDLWQHAMKHFSPPHILRFLGKKMTRALPGEVTTVVERRPEGVCIKHAVDGNSIKMYNKAESVLRVETTINNPRSFRVLRRVARDGHSALAWLRMRRGVCDTARRVEVSLAANARYLEALSVIGEETPSHRILDSVSQPVTRDRYRYRALRPVSPDEAALFQAVLHGEHLIDGLTNQGIRLHLYPQATDDPRQLRKRSGCISRKLRLLRAHGLLRKVPGRHLYRLTPRGHEVMTTGLLFRQTDAKLLLPKKTG